MVAVTVIHWFVDDSLRVVPAEVCSLFRFPGGEPHVNIGRPDDIVGRRYVVDARVDRFDVLGDALVAADALRRHGAAWVALLCPYLPGARQDRGAPFTADVFARVINLGGFDRVICCDPHSAVMPALVDRIFAIDAPALIDAAIADGVDLVICPDAGAVRRSEAVADSLGLDIVYARKHRDSATGRLDGFVCDPLPPAATALVVDDICDGGGTFLGLAAACGLDRSRLRLWTTHGVYSHGLDDLRRHFSLIGSTDSFPSAHLPDLRRPILPIVASTPGAFA